MNGPFDSGVTPPPVLDLAQFDAMCDGDREFERMICGEFRKLTEPALETLARAVAIRDAASTHAGAHSIKGSASTLGGQELAKVSGQLERLTVRDPDWVRADRLLHEIREAYTRLAMALDERAAA